MAERKGLLILSQLRKGVVRIGIWVNYWLRIIFDGCDFLNPLLSAKWAVWTFVKPSVDAMKVEVVIALSLERRAIFSCKFAVRARQVELVLANPASFLVNVPLPGGSSDPLIDLNSH